MCLADGAAPEAGGGAKDQAVAQAIRRVRVRHRKGERIGFMGLGMSKGVASRIVQQRCRCQGRRQAGTGPGPGLGLFSMYV